jgi:hypothetical protein
MSATVRDGPSYGEDDVVTVTVAVTVEVTDSVAVAVAVETAVDTGPVGAEVESLCGEEESLLFPTITAAAVPPMINPTSRPTSAATQPAPPREALSVAGASAGLLVGCSALGSTAVSSGDAPGADPAWVGWRCSVQASPSQ